MSIHGQSLLSRFLGILLKVSRFLLVFILPQLLFFHNLRDVPDTSVALVDDERNTFHHHHGSVETQCLRLVNTYLADEGIDTH